MSYRAPPTTAPKPYIQAPMPYKQGGQTYRAVNVDQYVEDLGGYPPPPPPDRYGYDPKDEFPPPPAPPQAFGEDDSHSYGNVYSGEARYMRSEDYRPSSGDYGTGSPRARGITEHFSYPPESNYANIQINIAPPTPTNKEFDFNLDSPSSKFAPRKIVSQEARSTPVMSERPIPGPMMPLTTRGASESYVSTEVPVANKEAEVDALTDLLVKNMTTAADEDHSYWGSCGRCGTNVSGDTNACSALDNVYHIGCFTCVGCNAALQGKSFFAMETKPYCEACYINTLERCSVCSKPITDRLLRATGKPYHPDCFTCVVCGKSLDGVPFTVDATNQIHCIEDFHKKFAPRCCVCQRPIMPSLGQDETVRIVAMDKSFHVDCYRCEDCQAQLSSEAEGRGCYPLDDHILCKNCNAKRIQVLTTKMATEL